MYRVLLVDDDRALLDANEAYFADHGYLVHRAETARDALAILRGAKLDCVVLDVDLRIQRHQTAQPLTVLDFGPLSIDLSRRAVSYEGRELEFSRLEFDVLSYLCLHPGRTFSYGELYAGVWDEPMQAGLHNLQVNIAKVRQKLSGLAPGRNYIRTVRGKGYLFDPEG